MLIYFIVTTYPKKEQERNLYSDLSEELVSRGHQVRIFTPDEHRWSGKPFVQTLRGPEIVMIPSGPIQKTHPIIKLANTLRYRRRLGLIASADAEAQAPHLLIYTTPPNDIAPVVKRLKAKTNCTTYLLLKDIFPANAADLGMIPKGGLAWRHFRRVEKSLYSISDHIGCMSPANKKYLECHNPELDPNRIEICPNSIQPTPTTAQPSRNKATLTLLNIPSARLNLLYGGNLGTPQGIDFLIEALRATQDDPEVHITIVGDGTEFSRLETFKAESRHAFTLLRRIPRQDYSTILHSMDAGLILLDRRFTIPNFPSRLLDYLDAGLPVLAATDPNTDIGTFLEQEKCGFWSKAGELSAFLANVEALKNESLRLQMGRNARTALEAHFTVQRSADIILRHFEG